MINPDLGWGRVEQNGEIELWASYAKLAAFEKIADPDLDHWYRCQRTWFVGVDCLPNDKFGRIKNGPDFPGVLKSFLPDIPFHAAQISAIFPGYPRQLEGESEAAARFRINRDAAHVDGLLPTGTDHRRMLREPHAYILGIPLTNVSDQASPLVVWEGSHRIMQAAFRKAFDPHPVEVWKDIDVTDVYQSARRTCFETCPRVELSAKPGEALILHRLALHGMSRWKEKKNAPRIVAYFRPETTMKRWLNDSLLGV